MGEYYRPNFFVNTPDINPIPLQTVGPRRLHRPRDARRHPVRRVGPLFELRAVRGDAAAGPGGVSRLREVRDQGLGLEPAREHPRPHRRAEHDPPRKPGVSHDFRNMSFLNAWNDNVIAYCEADAVARQLRRGARQPRHQEPAGCRLRNSALGVRPPRSCHDRGRRFARWRTIHAAEQEPSGSPSIRSPGPLSSGA